MTEGMSLVWTFRNRPETLIRSILTAHETAPLDTCFYLVDANSKKENLQQIKNVINGIIDREIRMCETFARTNVSEAWNLGLMLTDTQYVVFASSDVEFINKGWYEEFVTAFNNGHQYVLMPNHALFALDKKIIPKIGWFDEEYIPGPHFDTDYYVRVSEGEINTIGLNNNDFYEHGHDDVEIESQRVSAQNNDPKFDDRLPMNDLTNENYFKSKWNSNWPGWHVPVANIDEHGNIYQDIVAIHPPNHISLAARAKPEINAHPIYSKKYE